MRPYEFPNFRTAIEQAGHQLQFRSSLVHSARWQGADIANRPEMATHELTHISFAVPLIDPALPPGVLVDILEEWRQDIKPNLPWADDHFQERICGAPINPGVEWKNWPYGKSAATFLDPGGKFNHNYMERYWPKQAGRPREGTFTPEDWREKFIEEQRCVPEDILPNTGTHHNTYGDLNDVIRLLAEDPYTRQAYLPVWFPEDTGGGAKRAPCTIGYHFLMRDGKIDVNYHIRSCDFVRHFRDDIYLTNRLVLHIMLEASKINDDWRDVKLGKFVMQIGSLHIFRNDYNMLFKSRPPENRL